MLAATSAFAVDANNITPAPIAQTERLRAQLTGTDFSSRCSAAIELSRAGDNSGVPVLIEAMSTLTNQNERGNCMVALRIIKDPRAIPLFIKMSNDKAPLIRSVALAGLGAMNATNAFNLLVHHLDDVESHSGCIPMYPAESACSALGAIGSPQAIPHLIKALDRKEIQSEAAKALQKITGHDFKTFAEWRTWWNKEGTQQTNSAYVGNQRR